MQAIHNAEAVGLAERIVPCFWTHLPACEQTRLGRSMCALCCVPLSVRGKLVLDRCVTCSRQPPVH